LYFDLGKVLVHFDHDQMCRQLAELAGVPTEKVRGLIFDGELMHAAEVGEIQQDELYRRFCAATNAQPSLAEFRHAISAIFALNVDMVPVVTQLVAARQPIGILSNTIEAHWDYVSQGRYGMIPTLFDAFALSYQVHAAKPERAVYVAAAQLAGYEPGEIFFVDDRPENVAGAREAGYEAVLFTDAPQFAVELRKHGFRFNY
jgi:putative hydrolase of the HAD superfamily